MDKKAIIWTVVVLAVIVVVLLSLGGGVSTDSDREDGIDLSGVKAPDVGSEAQDSNYEDVAVPRHQTEAGSSSGTRDASVRFFDIVFEDGEISPKTIIINREDSVRISVRSTDGEDYNFTIEDYAQSRDIPADGSEQEIRFSAYSVGEFPITCSTCGDGEIVGTFVVVPGSD